MENIVASFVEKLNRSLTEEQQELLFFLYRTLHVDKLNDEEQLLFIDYFCSSDALQMMAAYALSLADIIHEMEEIVPAIEQGESLSNSEEQRLYYERKRHDTNHEQLKQQIMKNGNVLYIPFANMRKEPGPMIVCLEQMDGVDPNALICKSMILPLFKTAHRERRDLYIVLYNRQIHRHYRFENGCLRLRDFFDFIECNEDGEVAIIPVLQFAKELLQENQHRLEAEVIIFTKGVPIDGHKLVKPNVKMMIQEMKSISQTEISVVVMQEQNFNEQQFWFANKVFFTEDSI